MRTALLTRSVSKKKKISSIRQCLTSAGLFTVELPLPDQPAWVGLLVVVLVTWTTRTPLPFIPPTSVQVPAHPGQSPLRVLFQRAQEEGQVVGRQVCPELRDVLLDVLLPFLPLDRFEGPRLCFWRGDFDLLRF